MSKKFPITRALRFVIVLFISIGSAFAASSEQVLYRFQGGSDGAEPQAGLISDNAGSLYGNTLLGGGSANCASGCGTVFRLSPSANGAVAWTETVLHRFRGGDDGANPEAPMVFDEAGNLYGSTSQGGNGNCDNIGMTGCGTIFELSPPASGGAWTYRRLHSFQGVPSGAGNGDAAWPFGLTFGNDGNLYGFGLSGGHCKTDETGTYCSRAAFKLTKTDSGWSETVIYRFPGSYSPFAGPILGQDGDLYGAGPGGAYGFGGVFRLESLAAGGGAWSLAPVYDFHGTTGDGAFPLFGLVFDTEGNLFGASLGTPDGSDSNVFELSPTESGEWKESVLFNFIKSAEGYNPNVGPILGSNGDLYGSTEGGGKFGAGVVYRLAPPGEPGKPWSERLRYSFVQGSDGFAPDSRPIFGKGGLLYGTTPAGGDGACGSNGNGCGVVFSVLP